MRKGFLLASACVLSLAAAPVIAQAQNAPATTGPGAAYGSSGTSATGAASSEHSGTYHRRASSRSSTDTSQNAQVDALNQQSLQAAQQGRVFNPGGGMPATGGSMSGATGTSGGSTSTGTSR